MLALTAPIKPRFVIILLGVASLGGLASAEDAVDFFEAKIRPVLVKHCYECHAEESDVIQGGLRLDHPQAMIQGGDSGALLVPGDPDKSLLISALRYDELEMPPDGKLDQRIIRDFETWIKAGAKDPREHQPLPPLQSPGEINWQEAKQFWAFQPPTSQRSPATAGQPSTKLDSFVLARLEAVGLVPNPPADRRSLIRRVTFDLTGLPPTWQEVKAFVDDERPDAFRRVVERLLGSPQHAERWTRLWLDVARYAEDQAHKVGNNDSLTYPNAYLYRDWVIEALAADLPYDQFIRLQLAADLIDPNDQDVAYRAGISGARSEVLSPQQPRSDGGRMGRSRRYRHARTVGADRCLRSLSRSQVRPDSHLRLLRAGRRVRQHPNVQPADQRRSRAEIG